MPRPSRSYELPAALCAGLAAVLVATVVPPPASAAMANPGFVAPDTRFDEAGRPAPDQTNDSDRLFVRLLAVGNRAEIRVARMAPDKTRTEEIRAFAGKMATEHSATGDKLGAIVERLGLRVPERPGPDQKRDHDALDRLDGRGFDIAFARHQTAEHAKTASLLRWQLSTGQNAELIDFAQALLVDVEMHLASARELEMRLTGAGGMPRPRRD